MGSEDSRYPFYKFILNTNIIHKNANTYIKMSVFRIQHIVPLQCQSIMSQGDFLH
jgi:hypothetical protein